MDIRMPEMGGIEALEQIRRNGLKIPVIILTSSTTKEVAVEAIA